MSSTMPMSVPESRWPRLHYGWVLVLAVLTFGWFWSYWLYRQARSAQSVALPKQVYGWSVVCLVLASILWCFNAYSFAVLLSGGVGDQQHGYLEGAVGALGVVVAFGLQEALETLQPPVEMSGWMTFFFGPIYLQYQMNTLP